MRPTSGVASCWVFSDGGFADGDKLSVLKILSIACFFRHGFEHVQYSDTLVQYSDTLEQFSNALVQYIDTLVQCSDTVHRYTDTVQRYTCIH